MDLDKIIQDEFKKADFTKMRDIVMECLVEEGYAVGNEAYCLANTITRKIIDKREEEKEAKRVYWEEHAKHHPVD